MAISSFLKKENDWLRTKVSSGNLRVPVASRPTNTTPVSFDAGVETNTGSNNGKLLGGLGYMGHKLGLGVLSTIEGIWDYSASGVAKLVGADAWAERQVATDWVNYNAADEWFDPGTGWKVAGDVSSGIGTSLTSLVPVGIGAAITVASGGTLSPVACGIISASTVGIAGGGAAGNAVKEAYQETGELTGKEYVYGAGVGVVEGGIEAVSNLIGVGTAGRALKELGEGVAKGGAKAATKTAVKSTAKAVGKNATKKVLRQIGEDFAGEAIEEAISEWASPYIARATYDPNAEKATPGEIAYAAIVGGLSGAIMSGGSVVAKSASNYEHGNKLINAGKADQALTLGKYFAESEQGTASGISSWQQVSEIYNELKSTVPDGADIQVSDLTSTKQKMLLGALSKQSALATMMPEVERSAINLVMHPEQTVQTLNEYGKIAGNAVTFTVEHLLEGVDTSDLNSEQGRQRFRQSLHRALSSNSALTRMAVADATGRLTIDTMKFSHARAEVLRAASATDLNRFRETATQAELDTLGKRLGVENWDVLTNEQFHASLDPLVENEQDLADYNAAHRRISEARAALAEDAKSMPHTLRRNMNDGTYRFEGDGARMAIIKEGESYYIVDYDTGYISRKLTVSEVNRVLRQIRDGVASSAVIEQIQGTENITENADENARLALAENGKKRYNGKRRYLQISKEEYAVISASIMAKNADAIANGQELEPSGYTQSADYFYVYENLDASNFGVIKRIKIIDKNLGLIKEIRGNMEVKDGQQAESSGTGTDRFVSEERDDHGFGDSNVSADPQGVAAAGNDSFLGEQSFERQARYTRQGDRTDGGRGRVTSAAIGVWAQENVPGYDKLADPARTAVRATIRQARALGISEENIKLYASVAARSGINVVFDVTVKGDALYDGRNTIYVDPAAPVERMRSKLLLHEGGHALFARTSKGRRLLDAAYRAIEKNNPDRAKEIRERYEDHYAGSNLSAEILEGIVKEEQGVAYLEDVLGEVDAWSYILAEEPQYESKLISFFAKAAQDYKHLKGMPAEARKLLRQYKKLFAELSAYNQGNNALDPRPAETKKAVTRTNEENMHVTVEENSRLAIKKDADGNLFVEVDAPSGVSATDTPKDIVDTLAEIVRTKFADFVKVNGQTIGINQRTTREWVKSRSAATLRRFSNQAFLDKSNAFGNADELLKAARDYIGEATKHDRSDNFVEFARGVVAFQVDGRGYEADIIVGTTKSGVALLYDLVNIQGKKIVADTSYAAQDRRSDISATTNSIPDFTGKVNTNSEKTSNERHALPEDGAKKGYTLKELLDGADDFTPDLILRVEADVHQGKKYSITDGEVRYKMADNFRDRAYTKRAAYQVIREINGTSFLSEKSRTKLAEMLWTGLNRCATTDQRKTFARDMARYTVATLMVDAKQESPDAAVAREQLSSLHVGLHSLTFTSQEISRITELCDQQKAKRLLDRWARKEGERQYPLDLFVSEVAQSVSGLESLGGMATVEALLEIDKRYGKLTYAARARTDTLVFENLSNDEINGMVAQVEEEILRAYKEAGTKSKFTRRVEERTEDLSRRAERLRADLDNVKGRDKLNGVLTAQAQRMKDLKLGTFANATQYRSEVFKGSIEQLSNIQWRGNTYPTRIRKIFGDLTTWYTSENPLLKEQYSEEIAEAMREIASAEGVMSTDELRTASKIIDHFIHLVENYNKVWRDGKWEDALPIAKEYVAKLQAEAARPQSIGERMLRSKWILKYNENFADPAELSRMMDGYEHGFFTEMHEQLRVASLNAQVAEMEIRTEYDAFLKKNKRYLKNAYDEDVEYRGNKISRITLISLYMTMKREQAKAGVAASGFKYKDRKGTWHRVDALVRMDADVTEQDLIRATDEERAVIERMLTDADKQYVAILEKVYNNQAKQLKAERDMQRLGFTNALEGYYYPIRRANVARSVDTSEMQAELDRVSRASFNKNTVKGAKQELVIESADIVFNRHLRGVCQYAYLSPTVEFYDKIYNLDTVEFANKPVSVATASEAVWENGNKYFKKLLADAQGVSPAPEGFSKVLGKTRGNYAKYQLGANPKVWVSQLSSFFAAYSQLDADCITRGWFVSSRDIDAYSSLAKLRNYDNVAAEAQGVLDSRAKVLSGAANATNKVGDVLMAPIGMVDRFVVTRLFGACQVQVEKNGGAKIGTDANKRAAASLLQTVIFETQQNSIATERSGAMRSQNEIARTVTMFSADSMKMMGRVIDGFGELFAISAKMKDATGDAKTALETRKKQVSKRAGKAVAALVVQAAFMAAIAQAFRWLYAKEKEEEPLVQTLALDTLGNMMGGLPIVRDVYSRMTDGYELDNYAYSAVNDLLNASVAVFDAVGDVFTDHSVTSIASSMKKLSYAAGQIKGIPTRNIYNAFYGLTKRFAPRAAYRIDDLFYEKNYRTDLYRALEDGDGDTASFMLGLLLDEQIEGGVSENTRTEMLTLLKGGYSVLPRSVPTEYSYEGETFALDEEQQAAISAYYATLPSTLDALLARSEYQRLTAEQRAMAYDCVYDAYRELGISYATGANVAGNKALIASALGVETLALSQVVTSGIRSDVGLDGKAVAGSKRKKTVAAINALNVPVEQKLLLICAKGYSLRDGDLKMTAATAKKKLLRYILALKVSKAEKMALAEMCGFVVKNGRIVTENAFK